MKIGFVLDDTLDTADGVQQYVLLLGNWLTAQGHEVHYLTTKSHRADIEHLHSLGKHLRIRFNRNVVPFVLPSSPKKIAETLTREKFDVLHVQMPYGPAFGARLISLAPKTTAIVGTFHIAPYSMTEKALTKVLGYWVKPTIGRLDAAMSVSKPAQDLAKYSFGLSSVIVPNMVDTKSFKLSARLNYKTPPELLFLGRLVERKGCEHFIKSLALVQGQFRVSIAGDGSQRAKLEKLVNKLGLDKTIHFEGHVTEDRKRQLLQQANIAVYPSTGGESFGIVLIEAMAAGSCIVLAGDNPGYASVMARAPESLLDPTDHTAFAKKLDEYITNFDRAQKLYNKQQSFISDYDVEHVAAKVLAIYHKAVAKRVKKSHTKD